MSRPTKAQKAAEAEETPQSPLPVSATVLEHHGKTLHGPMKEWSTQKRVPPVLLLTGLPGVGKRTMAYHLAQWILCEKNGLNARPPEADLFSGGLFGGEPEPVEEAAPGSEAEGSAQSSGNAALTPCGECASCQRAIHSTWIDFTEIAPDEDDASGALKIDQFRKLKASVGFGAHEGAHRVILIPSADRMTIQAANSVLKLLEEPPAGWVFFLTAADATLLLPTIVSRCQTIRLKPFSSETLVEILREDGIDEKKAQTAAALAQGSWGRALDWCRPEAWERRTMVLEFLKDPAYSLNALVDWAAQEPRHLDLLIDQMESLLLDLIRWSLGPQISLPEKNPWTNADASGVLTDLARRARDGKTRDPIAHARAQWLERAERLAQARQELQAPLNRKILAQDLLLPWLF